MGDYYDEFAEPDAGEEEFSKEIYEAYVGLDASESEAAPKPTVEISNDVIQIVAGIAASKTSGVAAMTGGGSGLTEILGRKNLGKGVSVDVLDGSADIDVHIIARQGVNLGQIFRGLQRNVKDAVETMTGLAVNSVNVFTHGISEAVEAAPKEIVDSD